MVNKKVKALGVRKFAGLIPILILLIFLVLSTLIPYLPLSKPGLNSAPFGQPAKSNPYVRATTDDRLVFTYYFYWYDWNSTFHFSSPECADWNAYHPVEPENVSYLDPDWHYRELKDMISAGVDVVLPVYDGNPLLQSHPSEKWAWEGLPPLISAIDRLKAENYNTENIRHATNPIPKVGMFYDTSLLEHGFTDEELDAADPLNNVTLWEYFYNGFSDFFSYFDPSYLQQVEHPDDPTKPSAYIVWMWFPNKMSEFSQRTIDYVQDRFLTEFNHSLLFVGTGGNTWRDSWMGNAPEIDGAYRWMPAEQGYGFCEFSPIRIGTAIAGVNFGNCTNGSVCVDDRDSRYFPHDPEKYRRSLQALSDLQCNWVALDTWNEFHEGTTICRTIEHGDTFIQIAGEWSMQFHDKPVATQLELIFIDDPEFLFLIVGCIFLSGIILSFLKSRNEKNNNTDYRPS